MSKRGHYLGGNTVVRGKVQSSKNRKRFMGALEQAAEAFRANPPPMFPTPPVKPQKAASKPSIARSSVKQLDPTAARIARDAEERSRENANRADSRMEKDVKAIFRDAAGKGEKGGMKTTYAVHKSSRKHPRKVL